MELRRAYNLLVKNPSTPIWMTDHGGEVFLETLKRGTLTL